MLKYRPILLWNYILLLIQTCGIIWGWVRIIFIPIYRNISIFYYVTNVYAIWCQLFILQGWIRRRENPKCATCSHRCHASSNWLSCPVVGGVHTDLHFHSFVKYLLIAHLGSLMAQGKESTCQCGTHGFHPWVWRRKFQHTLVFLSGKSHGPRSLVGYSP